MAWILLLLLIVGVAALVAAAVRSAPATLGDAADDGDDGGGSQRRVPLGPAPEPSGAPVDWWPRFEREFAEYVRRQHAVSAD